jgi:ParB family chromosome partitioning protein
MTEPQPDRSRRLGRGLGALIGAADAVRATVPLPASAPEGDRLRDVPVDSIRANPLQPRREFNDAELRELEESMRTSGLLQPITVRARDDAFELIAGERRLRAAKRLGWTTVPALVREVDNSQLLTLALVENLQRADLNPVEEAEGYRRLTSEFSLSQQQVADAVGKDRSTVANMLRLLSLPDEVQRLLGTGELSVGHARALLALPQHVSVTETARRIVQERLSVRDVERLAQEHKSSTPRPRPRQQTSTPSPEIRQITDRLRRHLQTDVQVIETTAGQGELRIRFYSADDLDRLLELITGPSEEGY